MGKKQPQPYLYRDMNICASCEPPSSSRHMCCSKWERAAVSMQLPHWLMLPLLTPTPPCFPPTHRG